MLLLLPGCFEAMKESALQNPLNIDDDGDGFTEFEGDCDDTNVNINPAAVDTLISNLDCDKNLNGEQSAGRADVVLEGENESDWSGYSVSGAGDVDGDGLDDILIGAHINDES